MDLVEDCNWDEFFGEGSVEQDRTETSQNKRPQAAQDRAAQVA